jgi:hypothetical protein
MTRQAYAGPHGGTTDRAQVQEALFAQVCRSTPEEARTISLLLGVSERAALALFCNARAHLREHGRAIASACTKESLSMEGGLAGLVLFGQIEAGAETWGTATRPEKRSVSLAR